MLQLLLCVHLSWLICTETQRTTHFRSDKVGDYVAAFNVFYIVIDPIDVVMFENATTKIVHCVRYT